MSEIFAVSGQHYLFNVQAFAQTILSLGGDEYHYALRDRTTRGVIDDVSTGKSELGVVMITNKTRQAVAQATTQADCKFINVAKGKPCVALPASHPLSNAESLTLDELADWPYVYFEQEEDVPVEFFEECYGSIDRKKSIALTDRASLSELAAAINGYTITSGILVGITGGGSLTTVPLQCDAELWIGYIKRDGIELSDVGKRFVQALETQLQRYTR
jgi:hypothetical protein